MVDTPLKTLISPDEHKRRKRERDRKNIREKRRREGVRPIEEYLKERKKNKELLRAEVKLLRAKGLTIKEIANELSISERYVYSLLKG